jgi:hypothetical protein
MFSLTEYLFPAHGVATAEEGEEGVVDRAKAAEQGLRRSNRAWSDNGAIALLSLGFVYALLTLALGPGVDTHFHHETSSTIVMNYMMKHKFKDHGMWEASARKDAKWQHVRHPPPPDDQDEAHEVSMDFMVRSMMHEDWNTTLEAASDEMGLAGPEGAGEEDRGRGRSGREDDGSSSYGGSGPAGRWLDGEERLVGATKLLAICKDLPQVFHPRSFSAYYLDGDCGVASSREVSWDRMKEIMEAYSPGSTALYASRPALMRSWFELLSIASWCTEDVVTDQLDHPSPKAFVAHSLIDSSVCFQRCRRRNELRGVSFPSYDVVVEDPWLSLDWAGGPNDTIRDVVDSTLRALFPNSGYRALQSFRPRDSWVYACDLRREILDKGSVVVVFDVVWDMLINYRSGVFTHDGIDTKSPRHEERKRRLPILLVGWGSDLLEGRGFIKYFVGTLAYGREWGEGGYVRISESDLFLGNSFAPGSMFLAHGLYTLVVDTSP